MTRQFSEIVSCRGKKAFRSYDLAERVAKHSRRSRLHEGDVVMPYKCRHCPWFHVGGGTR